MYSRASDTHRHLGAETEGEAGLLKQASGDQCGTNLRPATESGDLERGKKAG
jgi:hypothetical protein